MQRALITGLLLATLGACADNGDEGILVSANIAPGDGCTFTADPTEPFFSEGQWSIISPGGYLVHPQMRSRIASPSTDLDLERTIVVQGANVDIKVIDADLAGLFDDSLTHFSVPFSAPIPPNDGIADAEFQLIPHDFLDALIDGKPELLDPDPDAFDMQVVATFTVFGKMSGTDVQSQPFVYGVTIGNNVVVQDLGSCPLNSSNLVVGNSCNPFQDQPVTCCETGGQLVCPGPTM